MPRSPTRLLLTLTLGSWIALFGPAARGAPADAAPPAAPSAHGPAEAPGLFTGPDWRYGEQGIFLRTLGDFVAIPAELPRWRVRGWLGLAGVMVPVGLMMAPTTPSPDARFDQWTRQHLDGHIPHLWRWENQRVAWPVLAAGTAGTWGAAHLFRWPHVAQGSSLVVESVAVAQVYHLSMKLLIGREGPSDGDGLGIVYGPSASFGLFPAGTPSGHAATLFSMLGASQAWYRPPWPVAVTAHGVVGGLIVMHVLNHGHFPSDSLWGAAMGYAIGVWVVQHRGSDAPALRSRARGPQVVPWGGGVMVVWQG
ncbi:phosphatase PAP2 family protein [Myxococcota bacterium]|nr:phosphatase PAP2 family protein [Myxococcota bacterium]